MKTSDYENKRHCKKQKKLLSSNFENTALPSDYLNVSYLKGWQIA